MEKCFKFNINIQYLAMSLFALVVHDAPLCPFDNERLVEEVYTEVKHMTLPLMCVTIFIY